VGPHTDPFSGQPEAKGTPASVSPVDYAYRGFLLTRTPAELPTEAWWSRVTTAGGPGYLIATNIEPKLWRARFGALMENMEIAEFIDVMRGIYRAAAFRESRLESVLFLGPSRNAPQWNAIKTLFEATALTGIERRIVLSGRAADGLAEIGPVICACFGIGLSAIREAILSKRATNVEAIGKALHAGTNCGSCLPELKRIVHEHAHAH
jgi:assimilatory nitrate reductase catalytic subunit